MFDKDNIKIGDINNSSINHIGNNKTINSGIKKSIVFSIIVVFLLVFLYSLGLIDESVLQKFKPIYEFFIK